jgi:hypothetical protein
VAEEAEVMARVALVGSALAAEVVKPVGRQVLPARLVEILSLRVQAAATWGLPMVVPAKVVPPMRAPPAARQRVQEEQAGAWREAAAALGQSAS